LLYDADRAEDDSEKIDSLLGLVVSRLSDRAFEFLIPGEQNRSSAF
jgi:hypothetical protein